MDSSKYLIVGDEGVGKMCLNMAYTTWSFHSENRPVFYDQKYENYVRSGILNTEQFAFRIWVGVSQFVMDSFKILMIGDDGVGKECLYLSYVTGTFPGEYKPSSYDTSNVINGWLDMKMFALRLWFAPGKNEFDKLRAFAYPDTAVVLICFSVDKKSSLEHVKEKWLPEVRQHCPNIPIVLVACKIDLRSLQHDDSSAITQNEGSDVAKELGIHYLETSSLTQEGVKECFEFCVRLERVTRNDICLCNLPSCTLPHRKKAE